MPEQWDEHAPPWWMRFKVDLPARERGPWRIIKQDAPFFIPAPAVNSAGSWGRPLPPHWPGWYRVLQRWEVVTREYNTDYLDDDGDDGKRVAARSEWVTWMSDAPGEIYDQVEAIEEIHRRGGRVLIGGLGLGVMVKAALDSPKVTGVRVLELDADIIAMVGPHYASDPRLTIVQADAVKWEPGAGEAFDVVWMDIWAHVTAKNIPDMIALSKRYRGRCGWYGAWCEKYCLQGLREEASGKWHPDLIEFVARELQEVG